VFNVGDSRVYRVAGGALTQLSADHSEVAALVAAGRITPEQARVHPLRNVITRSLGMDPTPVADTWLVPVAGDDLFLVCSDGLTGELTDQQIGEVIRAVQARGGDLAAAADALVAAAVDAGGHDNVTVVLATLGTAAT
jgi:protein phosphatase